MDKNLLNNFITGGIYDQRPRLDFDDVLIVPKLSPLSSRSEVNLISNNLYNKLSINTNGIIASNMDGVGTLEVAEILKQHDCMTALTKFYDVNTLIEYFSSNESSHSWYTLGMNNDDLYKFKYFMKHVTPTVPLKIQIDVANGYMEKFGDFCRELKLDHSDIIVMGGNIVDIHGVYNIQGVDAACFGIGGGSQCVTRTQTGIGYPQFSCILDSVTDINRYNMFFGTRNDDVIDLIVCSDGGCVTPGDVSKAFSAGADMVMLGGMLAGTDEGGGNVFEVDGKKYVEFYGMSSATAQKKHNGGLKEYRSSEGRTTLIPYKGSMHDVIQNILGGIRSTCTYVGASNIDELRYKASFIRVNNTLNRSLEKYTTGN